MDAVRLLNVFRSTVRGLLIARVCTADKVHKKGFVLWHATNVEGDGVLGQRWSEVGLALLSTSSKGIVAHLNRKTVAVNAPTIYGVTFRPDHIRVVTLFSRGY